MPGLTHWGDTADNKCEIRDTVPNIKKKKKTCRHTWLSKNAFTVDLPITYVGPVGTTVPIRGGVRGLIVWINCSGEPPEIPKDSQ